MKILDQLKAVAYWVHIAATLLNTAIELIGAPDRPKKVIDVK